MCDALPAACIADGPDIIRSAAPNAEQPHFANGIGYIRKPGDAVPSEDALTNHPYICRIASPASAKNVRYVGLYGPHLPIIMPDAEIPGTPDIARPVPPQAIDPELP